MNTFAKRNNWRWRHVCDRSLLVWEPQSMESDKILLADYSTWSWDTPLLVEMSILVPSVDRPISQLKKSLCSVFFGDPSSPLQPEHRYCADSREQNHILPFNDSTLTTTIMSSNAPATTTPPDRPSTNNPQDLLITPHHIPVVTQTKVNSPFEQLIRAIAINETEHVSPSILDN